MNPSMANRWMISRMGSDAGAGLAPTRRGSVRLVMAATILTTVGPGCSSCGSKSEPIYSNYAVPSYDAGRTALPDAAQAGSATPAK